MSRTARTDRLKSCDIDQCVRERASADVHLRQPAYAKSKCCCANDRKIGPLARFARGWTNATQRLLRMGSHENCDFPPFAGTMTSVENVRSGLGGTCLRLWFYTFGP